MGDVVSDGPHVAELLGPYYADQLGAADGERIENHLSDCASCRTTAVEVCEALVAITLLVDEDRDGLVEEFGPLSRGGPAPERFIRFFAHDIGHLTGWTTAAGTPPGTNRPSAWRLRLLVQTGLVLALVLVSGGFVLNGLLGRNSDTAPEPIPVAVTASASDRSTGVSMSILVKPTTSGTSVEATVTGLSAATGYRMYATTTDGAAIPVVNWTSEGKAENVFGDVPVAVDRLSFVTIVRADGSVTVSAYLSTTPATR
ncbi:zf-HC2 domain-containing protein [Micromonospora sp. ALFpr18c]|uniref:zf-HC2 domain-containing protein n=1 Tax=unclassified Micromonospora TaxID=2617518 RepID=UPI001788E700|nr:zf-HC2 domain-containing protein [Micromonospora sp. ALFpr18c]